MADIDKCLVNWYRGERVLRKKDKEWTAGAGKDCIGPHRDSTNRPIPSLSIGQRRLFHIQDPLDLTKTLVFPLGGDGDLLIMAGTTNKDCEHWIPPQPQAQQEGDSDSDVHHLDRINLTPRPASAT